MATNDDIIILVLTQAEYDELCTLTAGKEARASLALGRMRSENVPCPAEFEEVAAAAWQAAEQAESRRQALEVALNGLNFLLTGQETEYQGHQFQNAIVTLYELSCDNPAIQQVRRALGILAGHERRRVARDKLEAARLEVVKLLETA